MEPHGKRLLGRPNQRQIDKVNRNLAKIGIRDGETLTQNSDK